MRILLTSNASYLPPRGGSTRANLTYLRALNDRGHVVRVTAAAADVHTALQQQQLKEEMLQQHLDLRLRNPKSDAFSTGCLDGIEVVSVRDFVRNTHVLADQIREFRPDWVLVSSEDLSHSLLREAARSAPGRLVYVAHTPQFFPFGPASWHRDDDATAAVRQAAGVVVISHVMAAYVKEHLGLDAVCLHPPMYGAPPYPMLGDFAAGSIAMINPCAVKGISLFLSIADLLPAARFAALPGWGTTSADLDLLKKRHNVTIAQRVQKIEQFLERVKILLMPSLWLEGFGLIVMEAMLRGVPVISSGAGGLAEAKMGTKFLIPVEMISRYEPEFDERNMPRPILPAQSTEPWIAAIQELAASRSRYQEEQHAQHQAAREFVGALDRFAIVDYLSNLKPRSAPAPDRTPPSVAGLSDAKRRLLLRRLTNRTAPR